MEEQARQLAVQNLPWRRGVPWLVLAIEGIILLAVGIFVLVLPDMARDLIRQLLAALLLILSVVRIYGGFRNAALLESPYHILGGGIGAATGVIVLLEPYITGLEPNAARVILALGWLAYGIIELAETIMVRGDQGVRIGGLIVGALGLVVGLVLFTGDSDDSRISLLGWIAVVGGLVILAYAYYRYRSQQSG